MNFAIDKYLNAKGLLCPEPVMLLHKAVREMQAGEVIEVAATDPSTLRDIPKFCHFLGHELLQTQEQEDIYLFYIRKQ
jgi:tRNA 2-thiouridine synthesizing protein A